MSHSLNPFSPSTSSPGTGLIHLSLLSPLHQVLRELTYQYPLKLISPDPHPAPNASHNPVTTVFLLTYGGGLVGGDAIDLHVSMGERTRLVLLTQGSTKIFKAPERKVVTRQRLRVRVGKGAALCYLPDPSQPFQGSVFEQRQVFEVVAGGRGEREGGKGEGTTCESSLCVLDWVSEGRKARGESWSFHEWSGRNEVRQMAPEEEGGSGKGRLLLRDLVILSDEHDSDQGVNGLVDRTDGLAVLGTLILLGPIFKELSDFIINTFSALPRIGAKDWTTRSPAEDASAEGKDAGNQAAIPWERPGLLWTAARVRGCVIVKFGSRDLSIAKQWLADLLSVEGSVEREFGHQALFCLR